MANHADRQRQVIENRDSEETMNAAAKSGDNALQKQSQGYGAGVPFATVHLRNG